MSEVLTDHRYTALLLAVLIAVSSLLLSSSAIAQGLPPHSHIMIQGVQVDADGEPIGYRRCVELANNRPVPLHAHHDQLHAHDEGGPASKALVRAGNWVVPVFPQAEFGEFGTPWDDCATFAEWWDSLGDEEPPAEDD